MNDRHNSKFHFGSKYYRPVTQQNRQVASYEYWRHLCTTAKKLGIPFHLNAWQVGQIMFKPCHFCGHGSTANNKVMPLDESLGFVFENTIPICRECQHARLTLSPEEFKSFKSSYAKTDKTNEYLYSEWT